MILINRYIGQWSFLWKSVVNDSWWFRDPLHLPQSTYYRPLQDIWLGLHYQAFGFNPVGWHATMIVLHLVAVWLVFEIAQRLCGEWRTAAVAALLFGVLPLHTEAVVWPTAIPLPLSATLELGAFYAFIIRRQHSSRSWTIALLLYACALFTHEGAVAFPGIIATYVFLLEAPDGAMTLATRIERAAMLTAPFAAELAAYLGVRYSVLGFINQANPLNHATLAQVLMTLPHALVWYLSLLIVPWLAGPSHRLLMVTSAASPELWWSLLALVTVAATFAWLVRTDARRALYLFCAAWIGIAVIPMLNLGGLFQQGLIQDRYLYLSSVGWCVMLADLAMRAATRARDKRLAYGTIGAVAALLAIVLWQTQGYWHDEVALFSRCVEEFPESGLWHNRLGMAYRQRGDPADGERELAEAHELEPDDPSTLFDLGLARADLGQYSEAARDVDQALKGLPNAPADAYAVLAQLDDFAGDQQQSEAALKHVATLPDGERSAELTRATIALRHGDNAAAETVLKDLTAKFPEDHNAWRMLGIAAAAQDHTHDALAALAHAVALDPRDQQARFYAAQTLHKEGRDSEALAQCRVAVALNPSDAHARALLDSIAKNLGD